MNEYIPISPQEWTNIMTRITNKLELHIGPLSIPIYSNIHLYRCCCVLRGGKAFQSTEVFTDSGSCDNKERSMHSLHSHTYVYARTWQTSLYTHKLYMLSVLPCSPPWQPLRYIELFAGEANVWQEVRQQGFEALALDITYANHFRDMLDGCNTNPFNIMSTSGLASQGVKFHHIFVCGQNLQQLMDLTDNGF